MDVPCSANTRHVGEPLVLRDLPGLQVGQARQVVWCMTKGGLVDA